MNNFVLLYGEIVDKPVCTSIDRNGAAFYRFMLAVKRKSNTVDTLPISIKSGTTAYDNMIKAFAAGESLVGKKVLIGGNVRTRNAKGRVKLFVRAVSMINAYAGYTGIDNLVIITGNICRGVPTRQTPSGRLIADLIVAVSRHDSELVSDYVPTIMWDRVAKKANSELHTGDCIDIVGRLQSRRYVKRIGSRKEIRTCYELSVDRYGLNTSEKEGGEQEDE